MNCQRVQFQAVEGRRDYFGDVALITKPGFGFGVRWGALLVGGLGGPFLVLKIFADGLLSSAWTCEKSILQIDNKWHLGLVPVNV